MTPAAIAFPREFNAAEWFVERHATERPDRTAVLSRGVGGSATVTGYGELADAVRRAGRALLEFGLAPGDRLVMAVRDGPEFFHLFWGAVRAGVIPVPVNALLRAPDLAFVLADSEAAAMAYSPEFAGEAVRAIARSGARAQGIVLDGEGGFLDALAAAPPDLAPAPAAPEDVAFWLYSSGTTGRPKGVPHRHRSPVVTSELYGVGVLGIRERDICFSAAKLFFAYGLGNAMTFPLHVGGTAALDPRRPTPETTFESIGAFRPSLYFGVPTLYAAQIEALEGLRGAGIARGPDLSSLRLCVSAGEALPRGLQERWKRATGLEILDGIGSTEALHIFISNAPEEIHPGATGRVVPGYEARLVDERGAPIGPGGSGRLQIRGDSITPGYWNRPDATRAAFTGDWLETGDRYRSDEDGVFRYEGRADDMLKVGGIWCSPFAIEDRLVEHPAVVEAAVVGRADRHGLIKPEAWVVAGSQADGIERDALAADLVRHCREGLPPYMYPRWIRFVEALPRTATGKVQRFRLRQEGEEEPAEKRTRGTEEETDGT